MENNKDIKNEVKEFLKTLVMNFNFATGIFVLILLSFINIVILSPTNKYFQFLALISKAIIILSIINIVIGILVTYFKRRRVRNEQINSENIQV